MTANREDYLKQIYKLGGIDDFVSNKSLSEQMGISPPSVSEMLTKLAREGLVTYEAYKGVKLTEHGKEKSISLTRSHRLWEVFLIEKLGYDWSDAHVDAELLEHVTPKGLQEKLYEFLNQPERCPHGEPIPDYNSIAKREPVQPLCSMAVGERAILRKVWEEKALLDYLQGLGVVIGADITILEKAPYDGEITIAVHNDNADKIIKVSHKAAEKILIER